MDEPKKLFLPTEADDPPEARAKPAGGIYPDSILTVGGQAPADGAERSHRFHIPARNFSRSSGVMFSQRALMRPFQCPRRPP